MAWIQTPVPYALSDAFDALIAQPNDRSQSVFWLDSADANEANPKRSMLTLSLASVAHIDAQGALHFARAQDDVAANLPLWERLDAAVQAFRAREPNCPAGWVSWHGYSCGFLASKDLAQSPHPAAIPMAEIYEVQAALISDGSATILFLRAEDPDELPARERWWKDRLASALEGRGAAKTAKPKPLTIIDAGSKSAYVEAIAAIQQKISTDKVQQVCLTYPITFERPASMAQWYSYLRERSPASYCAFVQTPTIALASTSPESLFEIDDHVVSTRPMKGTRRRGSLPDDRLAEELRTNPKDRAENAMIATLAMKDLARVCVPDSAFIKEAFTVETYATVLQLTSTIEGELRPEVGPFQTFAALTPPASMTGTPRAAACEILAALESAARGVYSGSLGWIDGGTRSSFSVVIRALQAWGDHAAWHVGGGIIATSLPEDEWTESRTKALALGVDAEDVS